MGCKNLFFLGVVVVHDLPHFSDEVGSVSCLEDGGRYLGLLAAHSRSSFGHPLGQTSV
jgi:hypothetical protein